MWSKNRPPQANASFDEKFWLRARVTPWEEKWEHLSSDARRLFLTWIEPPAPQAGRAVVRKPADEFSSQAIHELHKIGLLAPPTGKVPAGAPVVVQEAGDFVAFLRTLQRYHLLAPGQSRQLKEFTFACFIQPSLMEALYNVLNRVGLPNRERGADVLERFVVKHRWPGWVAVAARNPLATQLLTVLQEAKRPLSVQELSARLPKCERGELKNLLRFFTARLALFEDLCPETGQVVVGFLPAVVESARCADPNRPRPALEICAEPHDLGPEGGWLILSLRSLLLELTSEPAQVKMNGDLFQKEEKRLQEVLGPVPRWMIEVLQLPLPRRLHLTMELAHHLGFVCSSAIRSKSHLRLTPDGQQWLVAPVAHQYASIYKEKRHLPSSGSSAAGYYLTESDREFLGLVVKVRPVEKGQKMDTLWWQSTPDEHGAVRKALLEALAALKPGDFCELQSFLQHATFRQHNPLLLGRDKDRVMVNVGGRYIPPIEEELEEAGRYVLEELICARLLPHGCIQGGIDERGRMCIARTGRLDAYFSEEPASLDLDVPEVGETRVIVQPDFSITIIGLNAAGPAAELAPFCARPKGYREPGAIQLKLTRESVVRAVTDGLAVAEILARLERHASKGLPANVRHEVSDWGGWVRRVSSKRMILLRCPDPDTAGRVFSALGRKVERLNDTVLALPEGALNTALRSKLLKQGVILQKD